MKHFTKLLALMILLLALSSIAFAADAVFLNPIRMLLLDHLDDMLFGVGHDHLHVVRHLLIAGGTDKIHDQYPFIKALIMPILLRQEKER